MNTVNSCDYRQDRCTWPGDRPELFIRQRKKNSFRHTCWRCFLQYSRVVFNCEWTFAWQSSSIRDGVKSSLEWFPRMIPAGKTDFFSIFRTCQTTHCNHHPPVLQIPGPPLHTFTLTLISCNQHFLSMMSRQTSLWCHFSFFFLKGNSGSSQQLTVWVRR